MSEKFDLIDYAERARAFDGETYKPDRDFHRLNGQLARVRDLMRDGRWRTLDQVSDYAGGSVASVSARLRDLRKPKYGAMRVERQYLVDGCWSYRVQPGEEQT
ncbi:MAG: hypothetical protein H0W86_14320 [Armatimonadetes bacterium]|nr:hypothetical protein [Armatimonadota bacterium]